VYGRIPLMLTERCFIRETAGCDKCGRSALTDRRGVRFPILREYRHRNLILNSVPTYLADRRDILTALCGAPECYLFTVETEKEITAVVDAARRGAPLAGPVRRLPQ
jgi:putative protease